MKKIFTLATLWIGFSLALLSQDLSGVRIYINPGHGGYDSDDRNVVIAPFKSGDPNGFWESKSNLDKGLHLKELLDTHGAATAISRVTNTTADDLPLSQIVRSGNEFNSDLLLSIHSNAGGTSNHVLMLYAGRDPNDTKVYPTQPSPEVESKSRAISEVIAKNLYKNKLTPWAYSYALRGDKSAAAQWFGWSDGYGVLRGVTVPTVLSEGSMHDYIPETYRLMNLEYKYLEAWNFFKSIASYFKSETIPHGIIAGSVRDKFLLNPETYAKIANSNDIYLPINGATVKLVEKDLVYTTDNLNNGIYVFKNLEPGTYTLEATADGYHPLTFSMDVVSNEISYSDTRLNLVRNTPPKVVEYSPQALTQDTVMLASSIISMRFNWDIDTESAIEAFSISPSVDGQIIFKESNFVMEFVPDAPLDTSTVYTVKLAKSLRHHDGLTMEEDFVFSFKTANRNKLRLLASYPLAGEDRVDYQKPTFTFVFDKKLVTAELIKGVQVFDMEGTELSKVMRSLKHNTFPEPLGSTSFSLSQDLVPGQQYYVSIAKGIKDVDGIFLTDTLKLPFTASDERVTDKTIVESFETKGKMAFDAENSTSVKTGSVASSSSTKLFNSYSYNFKYSFTGKNDGAAVYKVLEPNVEVTSDSTIGLHIFGDLSGNEIYLIFNSENDTKEVKLDSIHYGGWKFKEVALVGLTKDVSYKLTGIKFVQTASPLSQIGNIFVDNMLVGSYDPTSVKSHRLQNVTLYPNPASDYIFIRNNNQTLEKIELYNLQGQLLKSGIENTLNITEIPDGIYIVKIQLSEGVVSKTVIIKH